MFYLPVIKNLVSKVVQYIYVWIIEYQEKMEHDRILEWLNNQWKQHND